MSNPKEELINEISKVVYKFYVKTGVSVAELHISQIEISDNSKHHKEYVQGRISITVAG